MVHAVRRHPRDRAAFKRQRSAGGQKIFHPLRRLVTAVRQQPVITHSNPEATRHPPHHHAQNQRFPRKKENCRKRGEMQGDHKDGDAPIDRLRESLIAFPEC